MLRLLVFVPSVKFLPGGAIPAFFPLFLIIAASKLKFKKAELGFLLCLLIIYLSAIKNFLGFVELLGLFIGPFAFVCIKNSKKLFCALSPRVFYFIIFILLFEGFLGSLISDTSRSQTIIFKEASHSARFFFSIVLFYYVIHGRSRNIFILMLLFVLLNKSFASFVFLLFIFSIYFPAISLLSLLLISLPLFFFSFISIPDIDIRFVNQIERVFRGLNTFRSLPLEDLLFLIGGPRLLLSIAGFANSTSFGVGLGESEKYFNMVSSADVVNFKNIPYLADSSRTPNSYMAQICYEIGGFRFSIICMALSFFWYFSKQKYIFFLGIFQLFLFSTTSMITPWITLSVSFFDPPIKNKLLNQTRRV
jgi:hypothetical protein